MKQSISKLFGLGEKKEVSSEDAQEGTEEAVQQVAVESLLPNRFQPRTIFNEEKIEELAQTIDTHGMIQPIVVRQSDGSYEIIAGERRWRAARHAGLDKVPVVVKNFDDTKTASVALIENLQREGLTSIEEANAYASLLELHELTQGELAKRLGKSQSTIANKLRLLQLTEAGKQKLLTREISERHARALLPVKEESAQNDLLEKIITENWNVKETEAAVEKRTAELKPVQKKNVRKSRSKDTRLAMNTIRKSVDMVQESGLKIDTEEEETEEHYQFTIRIPKA
ncbi:nucleoid occlusion protein [Alkalicoccus halolimnae]|uniref:Nucleoid occlusion protein n=1 Tax=Alkalicoccus halolimnae TaxID=1667239 RepID=A0A5C7F7U4_9BACI|nr:nucleoid occlusion protein [Alkalicoccus halolimnae]TXF86741.1 nucleoid occlusion protein [Alkalicoccus halolimnae]